MIGRVLTIAERDWRAQMRAPGFWVALLAVQILAALGALGAVAVLKPPPPFVVTIHADDPLLARAAREAAAAAGARVSTDAPVVVAVNRDERGAIRARIEGSAGAAARLRPPLDAALRRAAQAEALADLDVPLGDAERVLAAGGAVVVATPAREPAFSPDQALGAGLAVLLWTYLVLGLGLLLHAAAQERANRSLEMLLAAARPHEVVLGKLLGVAATLAAHAAVSLFAGAVLTTAVFLLAGVELPRAAVGFDPGLAAVTAAVFAAAFAMYGAVLVGLGVLARDFPSAENLARPLFVGLVVVAVGIGVQAVAPSALPAWLVWAPPFTPFQLLARAPGGLDPAVLIGGLALQLAVAGAALATARPLFARALTGEWPKLHSKAQ
ncbi:MAG TPA: ABC transporter permease [Caulobacteraceae bacterium]|nr:ABC transporter permease [Caulobacteraceae bacterium]